MKNKRKMKTYLFDIIECVHLIHHLTTIHTNPSKNPEKYIEQIKSATQYLPLSCKQFIDQFIIGDTREAILFLFDMTQHPPLPTTPNDNDFHIGETTILSKLQATINQYIGEMIAYEAEGYGKLFQDMVPKKEYSNSQTSLGSNVELEIHTEQAFSKLKPDYLSLACLKGDKNAKTYIFSIYQLLEHLSKEKIEMLKQPLWTIGVDMSFKSHTIEFIEGELRGPIPILTANDEFIFDQDLMTGINEDAEDLKKEIITLYYRYRKEHVLSSGQIMLLDNRKVVHGRSPFQPKFDGNDRFIIRSFVSLNFEGSSYARKDNSRTILSMFS